MWISDQGRNLLRNVQANVNLDLDTLMTESCYDEIVRQSKAGGLPLLTATDLKQIYEDLKDIQSDFVYFNKEIYYEIVALYSIATYFVDKFLTIGYMDIPAPEPEFGKTTLMEIVIYSCFHGVWDTKITAPNIYRRMKDEIIITMGFDDIDNSYGIFDDDPAGGLTSVIDSGYRRGARVTRQVKEETVKFPTFGPKVWTRKDKIPPTPLSRAISIPMVQNKNQKILKNRPPTVKDFEKIRDRLYLMRWSIMDEVERKYLNLMSQQVLTGRVGEVFISVLTIAKLIDDTLYDEILQFVTLHEVLIKP